ncbi:MAG: AAA family ATPase [Cyanobacteriota bacterium]|nr:AAA family ATPase [Cyanobacteriota bacterium]
MSTPRLTSYVPRLVEDRLAQGAPFHGPEASTSPAAVLLSDIQGFSSLVSAFSRAGRAGLEELTWALNHYFADLVSEVDNQGGDVLCIAGDAFLCYWPAPSKEELGEATLRAARAALAMQARLHGREAGRGHRFRTRIGIGAGDLALAFVGGVGDRWELVADGLPVHAAADQERICSPGEVRLAQEAWELIAGVCEGRPGDNAQGHILNRIHAPPQRHPAPAARGTNPELTRRLRAFLPPAVMNPLHTEATWLAEQRTLSVLMADLPSLGDARARGLARLHASVRAFQSVVERFEGTLRVDVDSKGMMMLAVFGLPPRAHEDDAVRALEAAKELRQALKQMDERCGLGIATGKAFCGAFGSDLRREYMLRGEVINRAARLMQATIGGIACDQATVKATRGRMRFQPLGLMAQKNQLEPITAFKPLGGRGKASGDRTKLVGRRREIGLLLGELAALRAGESGRVVMIEAEAGMGKTRLLTLLAERAERQGVTVLTAKADAIEANTAYYAWRSVFEPLFGWKKETGYGGVREKMRQVAAGQPVEAMQHQLLKWLPLLGTVLPEGLEDNALTAEMTGEVRAENTRRLLVSVLQVEARAKPIVLLLEDAHWLDSKSWALLLDIARSVKPLLVVVTTRPMGESGSGDQQRLIEQAAGRHLRLEAMGPDDIDSLTCQLLGVEQLPTDVSERVRECVAGNPFFCGEMVQAMVDSGAIQVKDGVCRAANLAEFSFPSSVEGVIVSRLDRLSAGQQLCLKVASVIGRTFWQRELQEAHPVAVERRQVPHYLSSLTTLNFTQLDLPEPDPCYSFRHVITRDVTYELMPLAQRQTLHRAIAEYYERHHAADLAPYFGLLTHHWTRARDPARMTHYLELAGQQALRNGAFTEAMHFFQQAIEVHDSGDVWIDAVRRALWEKGLATALYFLGELRESRRHLEQAVGLLDRQVPDGSLAFGAALLRSTLRQALHRLWSAERLRRMEATKQTLDEAAECYRMLGQIYYLEGEQAKRLLYVTVRGVNVGEQAGASPALARNLSNMGTLCGFSGAQKWADWYAKSAVEMAEREGQYAAAAYVWSINSLTEAQRGNWSKAKAANAEALRRIQELGDYNLEAEAWVVRATVTICEGNFAAAPDAWQRAREIAERKGNGQILCWSLLDEVDTWLGRDLTERAAEVLERALAVETAPSDGSSTIDKLRATAVTRYRQGRHGEAVQAADAIMEMISRRTPTGYHWVDFFASAVEVYLNVLEDGSTLGWEQREELVARATLGCRKLHRLSRVFGNVLPRSRLLRGRLALQSGRPGQARRLFREAVALATVKEMAFEQALALIALARLDPGGESVQRLASATSILGRLGAEHYVNLARSTP